MTPDEHTNKEFYIEVGDGRELYVQDWGNKKAKHPIVFLHGGPGGCSDDRAKAVFSPSSQHRVIFFDQRGCGKSLPYGSLKKNTTPNLVEDITKIADQLKLKQFVLVGGSWGSTLALAYALKYPKRIAALVLNGIFTGSLDEIKWLDRGGFRVFFPDVWERYVQTVPKSHRNNPSEYHFTRILGDDESADRTSGHAYQTLEGSVMALDDRFQPDDITEFDATGIRTEVHYMANGCFMPDRHILNNAKKLTMPIWLVQGRYDMVCPPSTAYELHQKLPNSHLIWTVGNHRTGERETSSVIKTILLQFGGEK